MSWYLNHLLKNKIQIRSNIDLESEEYNDLLFIEKKIKELYEDDIISDDEVELLRYVEDGKPLVNSKEAFGKNRISLGRDFTSLCNKIAFYVGGYFTDEGYVHEMRVKYNLTDEQVEKMIDYMKSKYKNKLMRKSKKQNE